MPGIKLGSTDIKHIYYGSTPIKAVYYGSKKIRPAGWTPGRNTVAYYPLNVDFNDKSGNNRNLTNNGLSISTVSGVKCAYFNGISYAIYSTSSLTTYSNFTISLWVYYSGSASNRYIVAFGNGGGNFDFKNHQYCWYLNSSSYWDYNYPSSLVSSNKWINLVAVKNGSTVTIYNNGTSWSSHSISSTAFNAWCIGDDSAASGYYRGTGYISELIFENKARTATEISNYYNQTKSNYGL